MNTRNLTLAGGGLALVIFFAVNVAANASLRSVRLDLTEDKVYTLEEGSKSIAKGLDEPINLYFYFSRSEAGDFPQVTEYADRIQGVLREYERSSGGNIRLEVLDPEPYSEEEDQAVAYGLQGAPLPNGGLLYFGLVGTSATDARESIPFFALDEAKQRTLEYDLSKLIWTLSNPAKKRVGILSALPLEGGGGNPMLGQQGGERWGILDQLGDFFEVEVLPTQTEKLEEIDVLAVIHPRDFGEATLYLIDQWALEGKPLVVFVDPQCDADPGASDDPTNPMSRFTARKDSDLESLFSAWGLELAKSKIACDKELGIRQPARSRDGRGQVEVPYVFFLQLGAEDASREDPVTRLLGNLLLATAGSLRKKADATTTFTPILQTTEQSQEVDSGQFQFMPDPQQLFASLVPGYERLTLGARVTGTVKTAFPDGKPGSTPPPAPEEGSEPPPPDPAAGLKESAKPLNLLVFSDADLLNDRMWMRELGRLGNQMLVTQISENVDLLKNAIESVSGGEALMGIRMRGMTSRPFERVQEIRREADQRYLQRQQELERNLQDAERRLADLQKAKTDGSEELVTAEQRKEEEKVRAELVQTRKDLRSVKHQLTKDIERLGTQLKWLNIGLMPALVCVAALALGSWRGKQRSRK
jgi:ABC-type uncharacterized transport system involved in gliding motility auxiliary subunit